MEAFANITAKPDTLVHNTLKVATVKEDYTHTCPNLIASAAAFFSTSIETLTYLTE